MMYSDERRRHVRSPMSALAWVRFEGDTSARPTVTLDLSEEGAQLSSISPVQAGTRILAYIQPGANDHPFECKAVVAWSALGPNGLYRFGLRLVDLAGDERSRLRKAVWHGGPPALASA